MRKAVVMFALALGRIGAGYFLSRVNVPGDTVREIAVPSGSAAAHLAMLASAKPGIQG